MQKGAIIGIDPANPVASVIVFDFNPDTMTRRLETRAAGGDGDPGEALRLTSSSQKAITVSIEIDAIDQLKFLNKVNTGGE